MTLIFIISLIFGSCDLDEFGAIKDVKVKTETRVVIPLAYGSIELQTLMDYIHVEDSTSIPEVDGLIEFKPVFTEIEFPDTFAFNGSILNVLSHLELRIETENRLPIGIDLELFFKDSLVSVQFGPSIECNFLKPAVIDPNGKVIESSHNVETIILTKELIGEYRNAKNLVAKLRFFLSDTENEIFYLSRKDFLSLNVGVVVQANNNED